MLRTSLLGAASLALCGRAFASKKGGGGGGPNVLFIAIDDLNDWVNCIGGRPGTITPNLDRLAARGVLFTNAHCSAPACNPSRASIMTGVRPSTSGVYYNRQDWRKSPALAKAITIPEFFRSKGYSAVGGGKIFHCLSWIKNSYGTQRNDPDIWDEYYPSKIEPMPEAAWPDGAEVREDGYVTWKPLAGAGSPKRPSHFFDWSPLKVTDEGMADYKVVDWAMGELKKKHERPFFQAVGIFRPHIPWFVPQKYFDLYPLDKLELPKIKENDLADCSKVGQGFCRRSWHTWVAESGQWKRAVQGYLASISFADAQLGRLIDALDASDYSDNTIVVLWSDHGMHIGEKEHWEKFTLWEEATRVPLMITAPGIDSPGRKCSQPVTLLDVFPTLVELCGHRTFDQLEGTSLKNLLLDAGARKQRPAITTWGPNNHAVRTERWRYIHYRNGDEELYDHKNDPDEFSNIADRKEHDGLKESLGKWLPKVNADSVE
jgi:arylsulfatase A-like enzyme